MNTNDWHYQRSLRGMYRDRENGWIFGVCAGLAEFFNFRVGTVRIIAVICLLLFFWATAILYIAATLLIREKPLIYAGRDAESKFWRSRGHNGRWSAS